VIDAPERVLFKTADERRALAREDLLFFVANVLGYERPLDDARPYLHVHTGAESCHRKLARFIMDADAEGVQESLDLEPRGFLKTTIGTIGYILWCLARDPEERILLIASTQDKACSFLSEIKAHCEGNDVLLELFPALARGRVWTNDRIVVDGREGFWKEPSIRAVGIDMGKAGGHYTRIVCDDLHDEANSSTGDQCAKVTIQYQRLRPLLVDQRKGEIRVTGTRWNGSDHYGVMIERNDEAVREGRPLPVRLRISKLQNEDGTPAWPEMYDEAAIEGLRRSMPSSVLAAQYFNDPYDPSMTVFREIDIMKMVVEHEEMPPPREMIYFGMADLAYEKNSWNDETAIVVWGVHSSRHVYVVDIVCRKMQPTDTIEELYAAVSRWNLVTIGIEEATAKAVWEVLLRDAAQKRGKPLPWRGIKRTGGYHSAASGKSRIRKLEPYLKSGLLHVDRACPFVDKLQRQLRDFRPGSNIHDDIIDALADMPDISFPPAGAVQTQEPFSGHLRVSTAEEWKAAIRGNRPVKTLDGVSVGGGGRLGVVLVES